MAIEATELVTMRDALIRARAQGVRKVEVDGLSTEYKSDGEMAAAISDLNRQIAQASNHAPKTVTFKTSKGL